MKKPNLRTLEAALASSKSQSWHDPATGHTVKITLSGFYSVQKEGHTRLFQTLRDAWRAL